MHDTAFNIGCLAMDIYSNLKSAKILEIGSLNVNGSLRDHAPDTTDYTGVDMDAGPGVDLVVTPGAPLPFETESFDLVMASSVFEHDPAFWRTFVEMCRTARKGGYIYVNAPSNGTFHRYPEDHWRFYPDSGMALARWAQSEGYDITLVESFVADRRDEVYNDFAAVFRKGPTKKALGKTFIHQQVMCYNVRTWESDELIHPRDSTEDMVLIARYQQDIGHLHNEVAARDARIAALQQEQTGAQTKAQEIWTERCVVEQLLRSAEQKALIVADRADEALRTRDKFERLVERSQQETADLRKSLAECEARLVQNAAQHQLEMHSRQLTLEHLELRLADCQRISSSAAEARERTELDNSALRAQVADLCRSLDNLEGRNTTKIVQLETELAKASAELADAKADLASSKAGLREVEAALSETSMALAQTRADLADAHRESAAAKDQAAAAIDALHADHHRERTALKQESQDLQHSLAETVQRLHSAEHELQLARNHAEAMSLNLAAAEASSAHDRHHAGELAWRVNWLRKACQTLLSAGAVWSWPTAGHLRNRRNDSLRRKQLFDADGYLRRNPDVAGTHIDPLLHFVLHGIDEGRNPV